MATAKVLDAGGKTTGERLLPSELFGGPINAAVVHEVVTAERAAARAGTASTKRRSEVRGGGSKPWRQKGTGRARHGSSRSPIWVGGGVVFGPRPRKYVKRVNKKVRKAALRSALADKAEAGRVWILDGFSEPRTKTAAALVRAAGLEGRVLVVLDRDEEQSRSVDRAFRNLPQAAFSLVGALSTYDVLVADALVFTSGAFDRFTAKAVDG